MLGKSVRDIGELGLIERIDKVVGRADSEILVPLGDDAAVMEPYAEPIVLTSDLLIEEVHFRFDLMSPREVGYKSMAVNISDVAAMAGKPKFAVVSIALDPETPVALVEEFYRGALEACERHQVYIVGGDTSRGDKFTVCVSLLGSVERELLRRRSEAEASQRILVTGSLGASAAGLAILKDPSLADRVSEAERLVEAHKRPSPRVEEARIAARHGARAMEDISDGLASEIRHIAKMSGVGAKVFSESLPIAPGVWEVANALGKEATDFALYGGEEYELVFTASPDKVASIREAVEKRGVTISEVGEITTGGEVVLVQQGKERPLHDRGYVHF
ncbi:MAG: thiamine-phosphate kinase [Actinobacteria bacterium]|nr:thiamine-phosphate kinase [Actinomycetota bacterium]